MDHLVAQYTQRAPLTPQEMRLLNWHYANLEYANAINVDQLSLGGWDQDQGNEFEGRHSEIIGGYSQVPRALWQRPTPLDVRFNKRVVQVNYSSAMNNGTSPPARIVCDDGETWDADLVVSTLPLGVLQEHKIGFQPPLPSWKTGPMSRLGFGVLNKVRNTTIAILLRLTLLRLCSSSITSSGKSIEICLDFLTNPQIRKAKQVANTPEIGVDSTFSGTAYKLVVGQCWSASWRVMRHEMLSISVMTN